MGLSHDIPTKSLFLMHQYHDPACLIVGPLDLRRDRRYRFNVVDILLLRQQVQETPGRCMSPSIVFTQRPPTEVC